MAARDPAFTTEEYAARVRRVRTAMAERGIATLWITDPSNMAWLTGYDGWSFYVHQGVLLGPEGDPIWFGRGQDAAGALRTVWMDDTHVVGYPDHYVQSTERHPMQPLAALIRDRGWQGTGPFGVEMDNYYFSAACLETLRRELPGTAITDATALVNWCRAVKSPAEIALMRKAARIAEAVHARFLEVIEPGLPKHRAVAEIARTAIAGVDGIWGDYAAIVPLLPSGADAAAPHLTWDDRPLRAGEGTFLEIAGCHRRYHCPLSRTYVLGTVPDSLKRAEEAGNAALEAGIAAARPGATCEAVDAAARGALRRFGIEKTSRCGYPTGLSYPPDWGERTMSLRAGDRTVLQPGMTFHLIPAIWQDDWGLETTETILITETGAEPLANLPRQLFVKP